MKKILLILFIAASAMKANAQNGFQRTSKGTEYQLFTHNPGDRIKIDDIVTFQVIQKNYKDSILFSTYAAGRPLQAQIHATGDLMDIFPLLTLKDSILIKVPTDSIFKMQEDKRPPFLPKGSNLFFLMKIERIQSLAEAMAERDKAIAEQKGLIAKYQADESANAAKYIADNHLVFNTTPSGLKYKITRPSLKRKPLPGDTLMVNYTGRGLDGKVFDSSIAAIGTQAGLQKPAEMYQPLQVVVGHGEVIPGWDEGLLLLNEGSAATFIIPSKLAYTDKGMGDIKPFSTLIFDVELVKVKPIKHVPAKHIIKKPLKKHVAAKKHLLVKKTS